METVSKYHGITIWSITVGMNQWSYKQHTVIFLRYSWTVTSAGDQWTVLPSKNLCKASVSSITVSILAAPAYKLHEHERTPAGVACASNSHHPNLTHNYLYILISRWVPQNEFCINISSGLLINIIRSSLVSFSCVKNKFPFWGDFTFECQVEAYSSFPRWFRLFVTAIHNYRLVSWEIVIWSWKMFLIR